MIYCVYINNPEEEQVHYPPLGCDIIIAKNTTVKLAICVKSTLGTAIDTSLWDIEFKATIMPPERYAELLATPAITKSITGDSTGISSFTLTSSDTDVSVGTYKYHIVNTDDDYLLASGDFYVSGL